jgi:murein DD-endopeptidase MepM/ murein hydrolase activator NlpD
MGGFRGIGVDAEGRGLGGDGVTLDFDRQLPVPYRRAGRAVVARPSGRPLPHVYLSGARKLRGRRDGAQPQEQLHGSRFKWLLSSLLIGAVGAMAIGMTLLSSLDPNVRQSSLVADLEKVSKDVFEPAAIPHRRVEASLTGMKMDKLLLTPRGLITKHIIQDHVRQQLGTREKIAIKSYARVVAQLATAPPKDAAAIPPFNPFDLYANVKSAGTGPQADSSDRLSYQVLDLVGGVLPGEDGQSLSDDQIQQIVALAAAEELPLDDLHSEGVATGAEAGGVTLPELGDIADLGVEAPEPELRPGDAHTAVLVKNVFDGDTAPKVEGQEVRAVSTKAGDQLGEILKQNGVASATIRQIVAAAKTVVDTEILLDGQEVRLTLVPSAAGSSQMVVSSVAVFSAGQGHVLTVARSEAGDYFASDTPIAATMLAAQTSTRRRASLYQSIYATASMQGMTPDMILRILRTYAYDVDFQRRVGPGDTFEAFFDVADDALSLATPGELLFSSLTVGGETRKFYRFRTPDGIIDYYDEQGNNAKKFLNRKPIRGAEVRFTSGFGMRLHPLLKVRRMHTGADWAASPGTPILAAGNGTIEEIGRKSGNGNYIRIKHANGYQTTYSHMSRFASGLSVGTKVNQGDVIGHVGSTGLSSGPHLHFEVLVNNKYVDPMTIQVPRERQLTGKLLADFQKERIKIEELMARSPVSSQVAGKTASTDG